MVKPGAARLAVPTLLTETLELPFPEGLTPERKVVTVEDGMEIAAEVLRFSDEEAKTICLETVVGAILKRTTDDLPRTIAGSDDEGAIDVVCLEGGSVEEVFIDFTDENRPRFVLDHRDAMRIDKEALAAFSRLSGLKVRYCHSYARDAAPFPDAPGTLHFFSHSRPPGLNQSGKMRVRELFGLRVWNDGETRYVTTPTCGRGRLIEHGGTSIFQVMGGNVYQLCLVLGDPCNLANRPKIMRGLLGCLYRDLAEGGKAADEAPEATEEGFVDFALAKIMEDRSSLQKGVDGAEAELKDLQAKLVEKVRERQKLVTMLQEARASGTLQKLADRMPEEFRRLKVLDGVSAVRIVDDGLHLETVPIVLEHGGRRYDLGPFVIRIDGNAQVEVWSEAPRHPEGHHHPHIDKKNLTCFGTVSTAIAKLAAAYRFADTAALALDWLRSYAPELTLHPIEGWPSTPVEAAEERTDVESPAQPGEPVQSLRPGGREARDAHRRRGGRKPRGARTRPDGRA
jgi:hypothetical protein